MLKKVLFCLSCVKMCREHFPVRKIIREYLERRQPYGCTDYEQQRFTVCN